MAKIQHESYWINVIWIKQHTEYAKSARKSTNTVHKWYTFTRYESDHDGRHVGSMCLVGFLLNLIKTQKNGQNSARMILD